jgi:hypothetical protein
VHDFGDRRLDAFVGVGDDELDAAKAASRSGLLSPYGAPASVPISISISRSAAKPIIWRKTSASGAFSRRARRLIISSVIGGSSVAVVIRNPILPTNRR